MKALFSNPILIREINHRMRDNRTYFVPLIYLSILALATTGIYLAMTWSHHGVASNVQGWEIGKAIFHAITFIQMALVILLVPSVSAGSITAERDRGTLVPLLVTPMSRARITLGKLLAPILYILLLLSTSIPFAALSFGFGGTDLRMLAVSFGCLISTILFFSSMGLLISTLLKRTVPAVLMAYGLAAAVVIGTAIMEGIFNLVVDPGNEGLFFLYLNPFTPLVLNIEEQLLIAPDTPPWWLTPALQMLLTGIFTLAAGLRIRSMRE